MDQRVTLDQKDLTDLVVGLDLKETRVNLDPAVRTAELNTLSN